MDNSPASVKRKVSDLAENELGEIGGMIDGQLQKARARKEKGKHKPAGDGKAKRKKGKSEEGADDSGMQELPKRKKLKTSFADGAEVTSSEGKAPMAT